MIKSLRQITHKHNEKHFTLFLCQHKGSFGLVHCNSNLPAVVQGEACDTVQYPKKINTEYVCDTLQPRKDKHWLLVTSVGLYTINCI